MYADRIKKIRNLLIEKKLDAVLVSSVSNIFYLTNFSNFSTEEREAYVLITKTKQYIFTDGRYKEAVEKEVKDFALQLITQETPFIKLLKQLCEQEHITKVGFEENNLTFWEHKRITTVGNKNLPAGRQGVCSLLPISLNIRMQKDAEEIKNIQEACRFGDQAFDYVLQKIKVGVTEKELQTHIELYLKQQNADISFRPIVSFGANTSMPHYESSFNRKLEPNEPVLIDMGAKINVYCSDMTRTVFFGKPTDKQKKIYDTVLESQQIAIEFLEESIKTQKKISAKDVDMVSRNYILAQGYPSIPHSLGHGTGIDVHEPPSINAHSEIVLQPGMVFSIEPGIYLPSFCGVRIEDLVVIEKNGLKILTLSPKELIVL